MEYAPIVPRVGKKYRRKQTNMPREANGLRLNEIKQRVLVVTRVTDRVVTVKLPKREKSKDEQGLVTINIPREYFTIQHFEGPI